MFCSKCGFQLPDDSSFCNECGFEISRVEMSEELNQNGQAKQTIQNPYQSNYNYEQSQRTPQFTPPPGQLNQQYQPYAQPNYVPVYTKPRRPGRGFAISSMVLGIIGIVYSFLTLVVAITTESYNGYYAQNDFYEGNVMSMIITFSIFAILACIFSIVAIKKRYKNGVSISGLIMSIISIVLMLASTAIIVVGASTINIGENGNNGDKLIGTWVATDKVSTVTFEKNGEGELGGYGFPAYFTYTTNADKLTLIMDNGLEVIKFTYKIEGNKFTWTNQEDGEVMVFTKIK